MSGGFIGGMWYEEKTYQEKKEQIEEAKRIASEKKYEVIEKIIEQKIKKSGVSIDPNIQRFRLKDMSLEQLDIILDKWEKILIDYVCEFCGVYKAASPKCNKCEPEK